jgi:hypothetical protein
LLQQRRKDTKTVQHVAIKIIKQMTEKGENFFEKIWWLQGSKNVGFEPNRYKHFGFIANHL